MGVMLECVSGQGCVQESGGDFRFTEDSPEEGMLELRVDYE